MCGIIGMISKRTVGFYRQDTDWFEDALIADSIRGKDSTGVFGVDRHDKRVYVLKQASNPYNLTSTGQWNTFRGKILNGFDIVIGHNRKATQGEIVGKNAHPFSEGEIVLVHNGTIYNKKELHAEIEVDSHAICHSINTAGVEKTIGSLDGAYALVWYDRKQEKLFMIRNSQRPLFVAHAADIFLMASEGKMIEWIADRHKIHLTVAPFEIEENHLYSAENKGTFKFERLEKIEAKRTQAAWCGGNRWGDEWEQWASEGAATECGVSMSDAAAAVRAQAKQEHSALGNELENMGYAKKNGIWVPPLQPDSTAAAIEAQAEELDRVADQHLKEMEEGGSERVATKVERENAYAMFQRFKIGERIIFKITSATSKPEKDDDGIDRQRYVIDGEVFDQGFPLPVKYFVPFGEAMDKPTELLEKNMVGKIKHLVYDPKQSRRTIWVQDMEPISNFKMFNNTILNQVEWDRICADNKCSKCGGRIWHHAPEFTTVKRGPIGIFSAICGECNMKDFSKEQKEEFETLRLV